MVNPFFNAMGGNGGNAILQQFQQFMQQMRGQNPDEIINQMVSSGRITQDQLNRAQQQARQMEDVFKSLKGTYR